MFASALAEEMPVFCLGMTDAGFVFGAVRLATDTADGDAVILIYSRVKHG